MAILLTDAKLINRATIYATDISQSALETAKTGIYNLNTIKQGSINYLKAGSINSLSDYYQALYDAAY